MDSIGSVASSALTTTSTSATNNSNERVLKASITYYCLEGLYQTVYSLSFEGIRMYPGDQTYRFLNGCILSLQGRYQESIRELERCTNDKHLSLASLLGLLFAHRKCQVVDHDAVLTLEKRLETNRNSSLSGESNEYVIYYASLFLLFAKDYNECEKYITILRKTYPNFREGKLLQGWHLIYGNKHHEKDKLIKFANELDKVSDPEVLIVRAKTSLLGQDYSTVRTCLDESIVLHARFLPAMIEKIKLHSAKKEFDHLLDTSIRALAIDKHCIEPLRYLTMFYLAWDNNEEAGISRVQDLISSLELREQKNSVLFFMTAKLIARLAFRNRNILLHSFSLIEKAIFLEPQNVEFLCEMAYQCSMLARYQDAERHYKTVLKLSPHNLDAQIGMLRAELSEKEHEYERSEKSSSTITSDSVLKRIHNEIDYLLELNRLTSNSKLLLFLGLKSHSIRNAPPETIESLLEQILKDSAENDNLIPYSLEFYCNIEGNELIEAIEICLEYCPDEPIIVNTTFPKMLKFAHELVLVLLKSFPNHKEILYLAGSVKYLCAEFESALNLINRSLQYDANYLRAHILLANISIHDGNFRTANICLENALALDFQIRENISYILAKASILKYEHKYSDALSLLENTQNDAEKLRLKPTEIFRLELLIAEMEILLKRYDNSDRILKDLNRRYAHKTERARIILLEAKLFCVKGDFDGALDRLKMITMGNGLEHFIRSRQTMASIYLVKFKQFTQFIECFQEIVDETNSVQSNLMLGDAYMHILEAEKAIAVYEQALKRNPKDYSLIRKVGSALISAHYYERAVTYYKAAIKSSGHNALFCLDLAHLLAQLKRDNHALEIIEQAIKQSEKDSETNLELLITRVKLQNLLAQVQFRVHGKDVAIQTLKKAHEVNQKIMRTLPIENPDLLDEHRTFSVSLCQQLASALFEHSHDSKSALEAYNAILSYDDHNPEIYLQMAKIELQNENFDSAHGHCATILKFNPNMDEPILMMADITMRQGDFEGALSLYSDLLAKNPNYHSAIMRFIEAARRAGKLELVPEILSKTSGPNRNRLRNGKASFSSSKADPGLLYCHAMYELYRGNINEAIKQLFPLRQDPTYGLQATYKIIEICINPDFQSSGFEVLHSLHSNIKFNEKQNASLKMAEMVLEEFKNKYGEDLEYTTLRNLTFLARKQKNDAEFVLSEFMKVLTDQRFSENVAAIYGTAAAFMVLKQLPKARNQLKKIAKAPWKFSDAEYLEKSWILLADIYIQSNKYEVANELLRRVLRYNRSCVKAYELIGFMMEKESNYKDAAYNYEMAWQLSNRSNPAVGYKLAFNYMKSKRFVDAIDISQTVLDRYSDYPKIKKDILEKCRASMKT